MSSPSGPSGLHELDGINDQEVKDFRSKMLRMSEERMQRLQMMTWSEWLESCFSPQLEFAAGADAFDGPSEQPADLKVFIHVDQSQVSGCGLLVFVGVFFNYTIDDSRSITSVT